MTMNKLQKLKAEKIPKDMDRAVVRVKGLRSGSRVIEARFPAAQGGGFIRLALSEIRTHKFEVKQEVKGEGEAAATTYVLLCDSMATNRKSTEQSYELAVFATSERATEALLAIQTALTSSKKMWIILGVIALAWVVLFMPISQKSQGGVQSSRAQIGVASVGQQRSQMAISGGLPVPSISALPVPGPVPGMVVATGQSAQLSPGLATAEDDPFGLKIAPTGSGTPVQR